MTQDATDTHMLIAPSLLAADFLQLGSELASIQTADWIHFDVMDGNFVPNLSFGPDILRQVHAASDLPIDAHLMVTNPDSVVDSYLAAGAANVTFHWEAASHAHRIVSHIHAAGASAGIALNPATPVQLLRDIIPELDLVLLMSVDPGFGGQPFIEHTYAKLRELRQLCQQMHASPRIEVDGGVYADNIRAIAAAGADTFVMGSAIFGQADRQATICELRLRASGSKEVIA